MKNKIKQKNMAIREYIHILDIFFYGLLHPYKIMKEREEQEVRIMQFESDNRKLRKKLEQLETELLLEISEKGK